MTLICKGEKRLGQRLKSPQSANPVSPRAGGTTHRQGQHLPVAIPTPVPAAFCSAQTQPLRLNMPPALWLELVGSNWGGGGAVRTGCSRGTRPAGPPGPRVREHHCAYVLQGQCPERGDTGQRNLGQSLGKML